MNWNHLRQLTCLAIIASLVCNPVFADEFATKIEPVEFARTPTILNCNGAPEEDQEIEKAVFDVSFSRDGKLMATGNTLGHVLIRGVGEEKILHSIVGEHESPIRHVRFIDNDRLLVSLDLEGRVLIWSVRDGSLVSELELDDTILAIGVGKDTRQLVGLSTAPSLYRWRVDDAQKLIADKPVQLNSSFRLLSASEDSNAIILANEETWQIRRDLKIDLAGDVGDGRVSSLRISPLGKQFALGMQDGRVHVHGTKDGKRVYSWKKHPNAVTCLEFSRSGKILLSGCLKDRIRVWDLQRGLLVNDRDVGLDVVTSLQLTRDNQVLSAAGMGDSCSLFDVQVPSTKFIPAVHRPVASNRKAVQAVRFLPADGQIAIVAKSHAAELLDLETKLITKGAKIDVGNGRLRAVAISSNGSLNAHSFRPGKLRIFETASAKLRLEMDLSAAADAIDFSPDSKFLAVVTSSDATLKLLDIDTGKWVWTRRATDSLRRVCFDSAGKSIYTTGRLQGGAGQHIGVVTRTSASDGKEIASVQSSVFYDSVDVSPTGKRIVTGGVTGCLSVLDDDLKQINSFDVGGRGGIHALKLMDDHRVLVGTFKGSVLMVDIDSGKELARLEPLPVHRLMPIRAIDYCPAKQLVMAVGGYDGAETMRLYKLSDDQQRN